MILNLNSDIFKEETLYRKLEKYNISKQNFKSLVYKHKFLQYSLMEILEYANFFYKARIPNKVEVLRMFKMDQAQIMAGSLKKRGEVTVHITFFPPEIQSFLTYTLKLNKCKKQNQ